MGSRHWPTSNCEPHDLTRARERSGRQYICELEAAPHEDARHRFIFALTGALMTAGAHAAEQPQTLRLESYFKGRTHAAGCFAAINGVKRRFLVVLQGRWRESVLTLEEKFAYDDGTA